MSDHDNKYSDAISDFLKDAIVKLKDGSSQLESRHIDELSVEVPTDKADQVKLSFELYRLLLDAYSQYSADVQALLVIGVEDSSFPEKHTIKELFSGSLNITPPPELYLIKRVKPTEPYVVEEHKTPFKQDLVSSTTGCVYGYFRASRSDPDDLYTLGFYFEHFPTGEVVHGWD